jgi:hypothetical protein
MIQKTNFFLLFQAIKKCVSIAELLNHSSKFKEVLQKEQKDANKPISAIIQQVPTRWNSIYSMLRSILKSPESLNRALYAEKYDSYVLTASEITNIK